MITSTVFTLRKLEENASGTEYALKMSYNSVRTSLGVRCRGGEDVMSTKKNIASRWGSIHHRARLRWGSFFLMKQGAQNVWYKLRCGCEADVGTSAVPASHLEHRQLPAVATAAKQAPRTIQRGAHLDGLTQCDESGPSSWGWEARCVDCCVPSLVVRRRWLLPTTSRRDLGGLMPHLGDAAQSRRCVPKCASWKADNRSGRTTQDRKDRHDPQLCHLAEGRGTSSAQHHRLLVKLRPAHHRQCVRKFPLLRSQAQARRTCWCGSACAVGSAQEP